MEPLHFVTLIACAALVMATIAFVATLRSSAPHRERVELRRIRDASKPKPKQEKLLKLIYVLADMRGRSTTEAHERVEQLQQKFVHLLKIGMYPVAAGVNTPYTMRDYAIPLVFEEGAKELCGRCDGLLLMPGFDQCPEASAVFEYAKTKVSKVFLSTEAGIQAKLTQWAGES